MTCTVSDDMHYVRYITSTHHCSRAALNTHWHICTQLISDAADAPIIASARRCTYILVYVLIWRNHFRDSFHFRNMTHSDAWHTLILIQQKHQALLQSGAEHTQTNKYWFSAFTFVTYFTFVPWLILTRDTHYFYSRRTNHFSSAAIISRNNFSWFISISRHDPFWRVTCSIADTLEGEVGGWGRDPKKCTGRDWGMGSSTI